VLGEDVERALLRQPVVWLVEAAWFVAAKAVAGAM
jgi:hypothetical protein